MNLFEAKRIAERNGYKVIKEAEDKAVSHWTKKKALLKEARAIVEDAGYTVIKEAEDKTVPPWAKKKAMLKEARKIVERAGYSVVSERYGDDEGDKLTAVLEPYTKDGVFTELAKLKGLNVVKQEVADKLAAALGHGIGPKWYNTFKKIWPTKNNIFNASKYLYDCWLKSIGQGVIK